MTFVVMGNMGGRAIFVLYRIMRCKLLLLHFWGSQATFYTFYEETQAIELFELKSFC